MNLDRMFDKWMAARSLPGFHATLGGQERRTVKAVLSAVKRQCAPLSGLTPSASDNARVLEILKEWSDVPTLKLQAGEMTLSEVQAVLAALRGVRYDVLQSRSVGELLRP